MAVDKVRYQGMQRMKLTKRLGTTPLIMEYRISIKKGVRLVAKRLTLMSLGTQRHGFAMKLYAFI